MLWIICTNQTKLKLNVLPCKIFYWKMGFCLRQSKNMQITKNWLCRCGPTHLQQVRLWALQVSRVGQVQEWAADHQVAHHSGYVCRGGELGSEKGRLSQTTCRFAFTLTHISQWCCPQNPWKSGRRWNCASGPPARQKRHHCDFYSWKAWVIAQLLLLFSSCPRKS